MCCCGCRNRFVHLVSSAVWKNGYAAAIPGSRIRTKGADRHVGFRNPGPGTRIPQRFNPKNGQTLAYPFSNRKIHGSGHPHSMPEKWEVRNEKWEVRWICLTVRMRNIFLSDTLYVSFGLDLRFGHCLNQDSQDLKDFQDFQQLNHGNLLNMVRQWPKRRSRPDKIIPFYFDKVFRGVYQKEIKTFDPKEITDEYKTFKRNSNEMGAVILKRRK